jgi:hypothetical protein
MKKISLIIFLCLATLCTKAQTGGFLNVSDNFQIRFTPSPGTGTPNVMSYWHIPNPSIPPTPKYIPLCNVFFTPPPQTPGAPFSVPFSCQAANIFPEVIQVSDQNTNNTAALSMGVMNGNGIIALEHLNGFSGVGNEALKLNPGCPVDVNICEGGGYTKIFNSAGVMGDLNVSDRVKIGLVPAFGLQSMLEINANGLPKAIQIFNTYSTATDKSFFDVTPGGKTSIGNNIQSNSALLTVGQASKTDLAICLTDNTTTSNKHFYKVYGSGQTFIGTDLQQTTSMFTVGQASKTNLALSLTDNTTATNKAFYNVYGSGKTYIGTDLQQNNGSILTVGQASKLNLALCLTDNTTPVNKNFYSVYGNGQTFIGPDLQQNTGAMFTVGQSNKSALALSLTDNTTTSNSAFFNVYGNGYTEIKVYSPLGMPVPAYAGTIGPRVLTIRDFSNNRDLFVVRSDGKVYAREVEINLATNFPDYVFAKNYDLKSISEVASYIDKNKHLPGFEKGEFYEKNGINVNDMIIKQQEKIEEQMLYIIQLQQELQEIRQMVQDVKVVADKK